MRVQRALAQAGVASRRAAEDLVREGRVLVNGRVATIGQAVEESDVIQVDGRRVAVEDRRTYLLNKAVGTVATASDPEGRPTVLDGLPSDIRLYPVGRLDYASSGLLLITNDGELAHRLMHPRYRVPKTYDVLVNGRVSDQDIARLTRGVVLDDGPTQPARVQRLDRTHASGTWLRIEITEGRNRQVRRMCEAVGHPVRKLNRSRYAGLAAAGLGRGEHRPLSGPELTRLAGLVGLRR